MEKIDIFSNYYTFKINGKRTFKTVIGGTLTLIFITYAIIYTLNYLPEILSGKISKLVYEEVKDNSSYSSDDDIDNNNKNLELNFYNYAFNAIFDAEQLNDFKKYAVGIKYKDQYLFSEMKHISSNKIDYSISLASLFEPIWELESDYLNYRKIKRYVFIKKCNSKMIHLLCKKYYESSEYQLNERKIKDYLEQKKEISTEILIFDNTKNNSDIKILKNESSLINQNETDVKTDYSSNANNSNTIIKNNDDKVIVNQNSYNSTNSTNSTNSQNTNLKSENNELKNENENFNFNNNNNNNNTANSNNNITSNTENINNSTTNYNNTSTNNQNNTSNTTSNTINTNINSTSSTITINNTIISNSTIPVKQNISSNINNVMGVFGKRNLQTFNTYNLQITVPKFNNKLNEVENPINEYKYSILDNIINIPNDLENKKIIIKMDSLEFIDNTSLFRENYIKTNYLQYGSHLLTHLVDDEKSLVPDIIIQLETPKFKTIITRSITTLIQGISEIFISIQLVFIIFNFARNLFNSYCLDLFFVDENFKFDNNDDNYNSGNNKKQNKSPENEKKEFNKKYKDVIKEVIKFNSSNSNGISQDSTKYSNRYRKSSKFNSIFKNRKSRWNYRLISNKSNENVIESLDCKEKKSIEPQFKSNLLKGLASNDKSENSLSINNRIEEKRNKYIVSDNLEFIEDEKEYINTSGSKSNIQELNSKMNERDFNIVNSSNKENPIEISHSNILSKDGKLSDQRCTINIPNNIGCKNNNDLFSNIHFPKNDNDNFEDIKSVDLTENNINNSLSKSNISMSKNKNETLFNNVNSLTLENKKLEYLYEKDSKTIFENKKENSHNNEENEKIKNVNSLQDNLQSNGISIKNLNVNVSPNINNGKNVNTILNAANEISYSNDSNKKNSSNETLKQNYNHEINNSIFEEDQYCFFDDKNFFFKKTNNSKILNKNFDGEIFNENIKRKDAFKILNINNEENLNNSPDNNYDEKNKDTISSNSDSDENGEFKDNIKYYWSFPLYLKSNFDLLFDRNSKIVNSASYILTKEEIEQRYIDNFLKKKEKIAKELKKRNSKIEQNSDKKEFATNLDVKTTEKEKSSLTQNEIQNNENEMYYRFLIASEISDHIQSVEYIQNKLKDLEVIKALLFNDEQILAMSIVEKPCINENNVELPKRLMNSYISSLFDSETKENIVIGYYTSLFSLNKYSDISDNDFTIFNGLKKSIRKKVKENVERIRKSANKKINHKNSNSKKLEISNFSKKENVVELDESYDSISLESEGKEDKEEKEDFNNNKSISMNKTFRSAISNKSINSDIHSKDNSPIKQGLSQNFDKESLSPNKKVSKSLASEFSVRSSIFLKYMKKD